MIMLPPPTWFCQRQNGRLVSNPFSGSFGISPETGIFSTDSVYNPIFEYRVDVTLKNNSEQESILRAECSVKIYRRSGTEQIYPTKAMQFVGITAQNLIAINAWLKDEAASYIKDCYNKLPNLAELYKVPEDISMVDYYVRKLNECRWSDPLTDDRPLYFNIDILAEGIDRVKQAYNEWNSSPEEALSRPLRKIKAEVLDLLRIAIMCYTHGIAFLPADVNVSHNLRFVSENGCIRIPFDWYSGLKREFSSQILQERKKRPFSSKDDFKKRMGIISDEDVDVIWGKTAGLDQ